MRLLLDTHTLIWWFLDQEQISGRAHAAIGEDGNDVFVSAASLFEISIKHRIGKLPQVAMLLADFEGLIAGQLFDPLSISLADARLAGTLPGSHGDPFDRMLAAQAITQGLAIVSNDIKLDQFGVQRLW